MACQYAGCRTESSVRIFSHSESCVSTVSGASTLDRLVVLASLLEPMGVEPGLPSRPPNAYVDEVHACVIYTISHNIDGLMVCRRTAVRTTVTSTSAMAAGRDASAKVAM